MSTTLPKSWTEVRDNDFGTFYQSDKGRHIFVVKGINRLPSGNIQSGDWQVELYTSKKGLGEGREKVLYTNKVRSNAQAWAQRYMRSHPNG